MTRAQILALDDDEWCRHVAEAEWLEHEETLRVADGVGLALQRAFGRR